MVESERKTCNEKGQEKGDMLMGEGSESDSLMYMYVCMCLY